MTSDQPQNIKKSSLEKLIEFFHAVRIIHDAKNQINTGKYYQITTVYGQLRALLTDKTKERSKELKPLFEIASILNTEIEIFYLPNNLETDLPHLMQGLLLHVSSLPISLERQLSKQVKIKLEDYLNVEVVKYKGNSIKVAELINALSDKYGGSHYDTKVPNYLMELSAFGIGNQRILDNLILQIAELFLFIGVKLVKKISDFEFYIKLYIQELTVDNNVFFEYNFPNSLCKIRLYANQGKIGILLIDLIGRSINLKVDQIVEVQKLYLLNISHRITADLRTEIKLSLNGKFLIDMNFDEPLLMVNELHSFEGYFNRTAEIEDQNFQFGIAELLMYGNILDECEKAKVFTYFNQKDPTKLIWFNKNSYGHSPSGKSDIQMGGNVEHRDTNKNGA